MQFVRTSEFSRARHCYRVAPSRAAFRREQIVPTVALVEMWRLREAQRSALENIRAFANELAFLYRVFLEHNSSKAIVSGSMVPKHVEEILAPIVVVKQRRIEAAAIEVNRIGP